MAINALVLLYVGCLESSPDTSPMVPAAIRSPPRGAAGFTSEDDVTRIVTSVRPEMHSPVLSSVASEIVEVNDVTRLVRPLARG